jgi:hypothetical protein
MREQSRLHRPAVDVVPARREEEVTRRRDSGHELLGLQRSVGNAGVAAVVARQQSVAASPVDTRAPANASAPALPAPMPGRREGLTILAELDAIHATLSAAGHPSRIGSGFRTIDDQIRLYAKGRSFQRFRTDIRAAVVAGSVTEAKCTEWVAYFDPAVGRNPMPRGEPGPVTWTFRSRHLTGDAADIVHATLGWGASDAFWAALEAAAVAQGLQIGPPATDVAHVQRP